MRHNTSHSNLTERVASAVRQSKKVALSGDMCAQPISAENTVKLGPIPAVSFVVPTRNSSVWLEMCLASIKAQQHHCELIVVDNHSTDGSDTIARRYADIVEIAGPERSAQRNRGAALASGQIIVFIDSDMTLDTKIAGEVSALFAGTTRVGAAVLPELAEGEGFLAQCRALEKELYLGDARVEAARAFRADAFWAVGGYDETLTAAEDWDLADKIRADGWDTSRIESPVLHHEGRISLVTQYTKKRYYGKWLPRYLEGRGQVGQSKLARTSLLAKPELLVRHPVRTGGLLTLKLVEGAGLLAGMRQGRKLRPQHEPGPVRRVLHCIGEMVEHEAMGRSVIEIAERTSGEHYLYTARGNPERNPFKKVWETGGSSVTYLRGPDANLDDVIAELDPDVVHFHGGSFTPLYAPAAKRPTVVSIYHWASLPSLPAMLKAGVTALRSSQVLQARTLAASIMPAFVARRALTRGRCEIVLTGDLGAVTALESGPTPVCYSPAGASPQGNRAEWNDDATVVFCGRAETVRGVHTIIDAMTIIVEKRPNTRCRLALMKRPELESILDRIAKSVAREAIDVTTEPVDDLPDLLAGCQLGLFPFLVDHVTLPPAYSITEALAVGLPVVATKMNNVIGVVDESCGALVEPGDPRALADAVLRLLQDPARWQELSDNAVEKATQYDFGHLAAHAETAYRRIQTHEASVPSE